MVVQMEGQRFLAWPRETCQPTSERVLTCLGRLAGVLSAGPGCARRLLVEPGLDGSCRSLPCSVLRGAFLMPALRAAVCRAFVLSLIRALAI